MYKVMVADDEQVTRKYLANNIPALCPAFQVTGMASDGLEAIKLCERQHFDLIITDIRMPEIDGLGLCKYVAESGADTRLVILSGYNEFEYARTAIKYKVADYILKPVNDDKLKDVLWSMKEVLDISELETDGRDKEYLEKMNDYELSCELLQNIVNEKEAGTYAAFSLLDDRNINILSGIGCVLLLIMDELELMLCNKNNYDITSLHLKLFKICQSYCGEKKLPIAYDGRSAVQILIQGEDEEEIHRKAEQLYMDISALSADEGIKRLFLAGGGYCSDILDAGVSGIQAYETTALYLKKKKMPVFYEDYLQEKEFIGNLEQVCGQIYLDYLKTDLEGMKKHVPEVYGMIRKEDHSAAILRTGAYLIHYICDRSSIKTHYIRSAYERLTKGTDAILIQENPAEEVIHGVLEDTLEALFATASGNRETGGNKLGEAAKKYIYAHFQEPVSLSVLADKLGVNSCYLSGVIHKSLGESYSRFLLRVRMERAVEIMKNNPGEKIYVIAEKVGFVSPKHFIAVFKKYYGVTPAAWMEQNR